MRSGSGSSRESSGVRRPANQSLLTLSPFAKEIVQQFRGFIGRDSLLDLHLVVELGVIQHCKNRAACARFGICGGVNKAIDARMDHGSGAHGAGLKRDVEGAAVETIIAKDTGGFTNGDDFCVGRGIDVAQDAILAARNDCASMNDDRANGNFAGFSRQSRLGQRGLYRFWILDHAFDGSAAGCCCVMQCSAPSPHMRSTQWTPMISRPGKTSASVLSATRPLG